MIRIICISAVCGAFAISAHAAEQDTSEVVAKVQKAYDSAKDLHAKFDQSIHSQFGGDKKASGDVWLKKPGRMRWDYVTPEKKLMISDGKTLWVYEPEDAQAFKQDLKSSSLPSSVAFLLGEGKLADEFEITPLKSEKLEQTLLKLVPKVATAAYRYIEFTVDSKSGQVVQTTLYDQQGGTNRLSFGTIETNKGVSDDKFRFKPPAGTKIIAP